MQFNKHIFTDDDDVDVDDDDDDDDHDDDDADVDEDDDNDDVPCGILRRYIYEGDGSGYWDISLDFLTQVERNENSLSGNIYFQIK